MAINSTLHIDQDCDALQQSMASKAIAKQFSERRFFRGGTKARLVEISDLLCGEYVRFGFDEGKLLQEKMKKLELENDSLLANVAIMKSREESMKERVQEMEHRMQDLSDKVREAEALTMELHKNAVESPRESSRTSYANNLQVVCHKEEKRELQELVEKLQLLCASHDISYTYPDNSDDHQAHGHEERDNETKLLCWRNDQCADCVDSVEQVQELQEELKMISAKLKFAISQRQAMKEVLAASATKLAETMSVNETLKKELYIERQLVQARENDVQNLETRVEALSTSNQMLKSMLNLKKMALESRRSLNFTMLEPKLLDLAAIVSAQNACVVRLSVQNETLARSLQSKIRENDHQQAEIGTAIKQKDAAIRALEQFKQQMVEWATEMDERNSNYDVLQEYVLNLEADLRDCQSQYGAVLQKHEELRKDHDQLLAWQAHARTRIADSEKSLDEREKEVESISREAMHLGLEVELLRRKLQQLDEDVMFKEGQISILRGSWDEE
jgi:chromosome segregation ATPase